MKIRLFRCKHQAQILLHEQQTWSTNQLEAAHDDMSTFRKSTGKVKASSHQNHLIERYWETARDFAWNIAFPPMLLGLGPELVEGREAI